MALRARAKRVRLLPPHRSDAVPLRHWAARVFAETRETPRTRLAASRRRRRLRLAAKRRESEHSATVMKRYYLEVMYWKGKPLAAYLYLPRRDGERAARTQRVSDQFNVDLA